MGRAGSDLSAKLAPWRRRSGLPEEAATEISRLRDLLARGDKRVLSGTRRW